MPSRVDLEQLNVLVVDDDDFMLAVVAGTLERIGVAQVTTCDSGFEALATIDAGGHFDVLLLDLNMPDMDGVELLRNLTARKFSGGILLFSGEDARILKTAKSLAESHHLKVLGALQKPVSMEALRAGLTEYEPTTERVSGTPIVSVSAKDLQSAVARGEIVAFFQPKVRVSTRLVESAEVLARWQHPERGQISPAAFIPVAEEHGLIDELSIAVFTDALGHVTRWAARGQAITISINLSVESFRDVALPERLESIASAHGVPCSSIAFEVTESRLMESLTTALDVLTRLRLKGFGLSIDDFGTGYSSMTQLANIPFTRLKIDRAFVHGAQQDPTARAILESSVALGKKLNMTIIAEGVEDRSDWELVESVGCDMVQGYLVAKPMSGEAFSQWLIENAGVFRWDETQSAAQP